MDNSCFNLYTRVKIYIENHNLFNYGEKILLSLSAGKDSMALLDFMLNIKEEYRLKLAIFHLNHMIRGEESDEDETFMIKVADEKGLDIFIRKFDFSNKTQKASFEEFARYKRYEIANEIC
ncbi:MAG: ATP-binding protein, partial [Spirochaetota bacterium]|nr:ATP-binding protein [Spirochaetota bacterium]